MAKRNKSLSPNNVPIKNIFDNGTYFYLSVSIFLPSNRKKDMQICQWLQTSNPINITTQHDQMHVLLLKIIPVGPYILKSNHVW